MDISSEKLEETLIKLGKKCLEENQTAIVNNPSQAIPLTNRCTVQLSLLWSIASEFNLSPSYLLSKIYQK
jgi:hypothetical protein